MPFSNTEQISPILAEIIHLNPRSILDVGCGLGLYGMLCRIHLDLYHDVEFYRKLDGSQPWNTRIDGIEGCETYTPFVPRWAYDTLHVGNALDILPTLADGQYDLILILAMIEHLTQDEGMWLISQLKRVGRAIILSVPKNWQEQQIEGYPLETHRSHWTEQNLKNVGFTKFLPHWGAWLAVYGIPPPTHSIDTASTNDTMIVGISGRSNPINLGLQQCYDDVANLSHELKKVHEIAIQLEKNSEVSLRNQQVILDRLSISSRFQSLGHRLRSFFSK